MFFIKNIFTQQPKFYIPSSTPQKGYFVGTPFCTLVGLYFIFILAYVISSLSRNLRLYLLSKTNYYHIKSDQRAIWSPTK